MEATMKPDPSEEAEPAADEPAADEPAADEPTAEEPSDDEPGEGEVYEGRLEIDPVPGGKRFQGTFVVLDEGDPIMLSYRPVEEYFAFVERRVVIRGEFMERQPSHVQQVSAPHFRVESIELADGEEPIEPTPEELPAPPVVEDVSALEERAGRWAQIVGTLGAIEDGPGRWANHSTLTLADDTEVPLESMARGPSAGLDGEFVTIVGRVSRSEDEPHLRVGRVVAICPGRASRCGMQ
jgi:hypothetical protein